MTSEQDPRPRPQYGEYAAPEAEWQPAARPEGQTEVSAEATAEALEQPGGAAQPAAAQPAPGQSSAPTHDSAAGWARLPGVPHNLGVGGQSAAPPSTQPPSAATQAPQHGEPYRAADPTPSAQQAAQAGAPADPGTSASSVASAGAQPARRPRSADRIITIALLALGAYFALSMAFSLSQLPAEFGRVATDLGVSDFVAPPQLKTIGTIGAILILAVYALVLIFSIRRLRAGKLTFWAPLAAGVLAWILFFVCFTIGLSQSPELWQALLQIAGDPDETQKLLARLSSRS